MKRVLVIIIIIAIIALGVIGYFALTGWGVEESGGAVNDVELNGCVDYEIREVDNNYMSSTINDCTNTPDAVHLGELRVDYEITNTNNIDLTIPCEMIFTRTATTDETIKETKTFDILVNADSIRQETVTTEWPRCYTSYEITCKGIGSVPECM